MNLAERYSSNWACNPSAFRLVVQAFIAGPFVRNNLRLRKSEPELVSEASRAIWAIFKSTDAKMHLEDIRRLLPIRIRYGSALHGSLLSLRKDNWIEREPDSPIYWRVAR